MRAICKLNWLTARERIVLIHLMHGLSAEQIAQVEYVTLATVRTHIRNVLWKLNVRTQLAAVAYAYRTLWPSEAEHREAVYRALVAA